MSTLGLMTPPSHPSPCIILIGMAASGKSTVGKELARELAWAFLDSDHLIEATYGQPLQTILESLGKESFLRVESALLCTLKVSRTVIATGGSVVYREETMLHLASLGTIVHLDVAWPVIEQRLIRNPQRGLVIAKEQTLANLFNERRSLYRRWGGVRVPAHAESPKEYAKRIIQELSPTI
jgi:shikimate kinase